MNEGGLVSNKLMVVMDTAGFLARLQLHLFSYGNVEIYATNSVLREVKDNVSREGVEIGLVVERVRVADPSNASKRYIIEVAREKGCLNDLSDTDIEVAALAHELRLKGRVVVFTDDYTLQNLLLHLNIPFKPVKTLGISKPLVFRNKCRVCGYPLEEGEANCPRCGSSVNA